MRIGFLPYELRHIRHLASIAQHDIDWPLKSDDPLGTVGDLTPDDHLVITPSSRLYFPRGQLRCKVSLMIFEPYAVHRRYYLAMYAMWPRFHRVISRCRQLERFVPNARYIPLAATWIDNPHAIDRRKIKHISLIASGKKKLPGHRLRHQVASWISDKRINVDLLGRAYQPFDQKEDGLAPFRFSVIIENSRERGYFTEKLIDCLLCDTIPIYWGAPDIGQYFNESGIVICKNIAELRRAITTLDDAKYEQLSMFSAENRCRALSLVNPKRLICDLLLEEEQQQRAA